MWTSLALAAGLLTIMPAAAEKNEREIKPPKITNARFLYSGLGMEREGKFLPADVLVMAFDIDNISRDKKTGKVIYAMELEFINSKNKRVFKEANPNIEELNALGGTTFATFVSGTIGRDTLPGKYTLRLTITDRITKQKTVFQRGFEVLKKAFGLVRIGMPAMGFVGQPFVIKFSVEGFEKDDKKSPRLTLRVDIVKGKERTLVNPIDMVIKDLDPDEAASQKSFDVETPIRLTRQGKFTIVLFATDHVAKKIVKLPYKITVLDPRKYE